MSKNARSKKHGTKKNGRKSATPHKHSELTISVPLTEEQLFHLTLLMRGDATDSAGELHASLEGDDESKGTVDNRWGTFLVLDDQMRLLDTFEKHLRSLQTRS